jgi:predicted porin
MFNLGELAMKKALLTLAVLGAASGAALAQSSVTLYGVADIALGEAKSNGETKVGAQSNSIVTNGTSRIGLTGKEDLGGGLWAGFKYEGGVNLAAGAAGGGTAAGTTVWNREAMVSLGSNSFGTVNLGRNLTPAFDGQGVYELTGWANYSVLANTFGYGAYSDPRVNAQLEYATPSFMGLSAEIAYVPKADGGLLWHGAANQTDYWSGNIVYNQGPIKAGFTVLKLDNTNTPPGSYANKADYTLGGQYKFGNMFALAASYNRSNNAYSWVNGAAGLTSTSGVGGAIGRRYGWELGGSAYLGAFTVTLDLTRDTTNDLYRQTNGKQRKYTNGLLEGKYALSKRTFLYADYLRLDSNNNYGLGIRHNF